MRKETPIKAKSETKAFDLFDFEIDLNISKRTIVPPSPLILRFMASKLYCIVGIIIKVQNTRERTPRTFSKVVSSIKKATVMV